MKKKLMLFCTALVICCQVIAQQSIRDEYHAFTVYRTTKGNGDDIKKINALLSRKNELSVKQVANAEYHLGRMYEEIGDDNNALAHYNESLKREPNYTVIHRAVGFIYLNKTKPFVKQMNEASSAKNATANAKAFDSYKLMVKKALPHLEKYQACEPDEQTLAIILNLYKSIKEPQTAEAITNRIKPLGKTCVTLLDDE